MGMTIEKAIDIMENYEEYGFLSQENGRNKAINTMRKYQKIEKIINAPIGGTSAKYNAIVSLIKYSEVVEDENDDC